MTEFENIYKNRRVLVTGHTGFKGGWLSLWLKKLGAQVFGISLPPDQNPNLYGIVELSHDVHSCLIDIRDRDTFVNKVVEINPEFIFHLAAQPLVRRSYEQPTVTFETNLMGTVNLLEAVRKCDAVVAVVCVTTDKVYRNKEWYWPYREIDELGGKDPYSASKAAAEIIISSYRNAFFVDSDSPGIASARGGNVIGGGDFSEDRLVPDIVRAIKSGDELLIRNPEATRPWQHVLSLCYGYLTLASYLAGQAEEYRTAWNFGPSADANITVEKLLRLFGATWRLPEVKINRGDAVWESRLLALDSSKANELLSFDPILSIEETIELTASWYNAWMTGTVDMRELMMEQIKQYRIRLGQ